MGALDQPFMLTENLPFCGHDKPIGVDPETDRPVGEGGRHAIAVALEADQAGGRDALALLDEAVEGRRQRHQRGLLLGPDVGEAPGQTAMRVLPPKLQASLLEPGIQRGEVREVRYRLPQARPRVLHVLLDLSLRQRARTGGATPAQSQPDAGLQNSGSKT